MSATNGYEIEMIEMVCNLKKLGQSLQFEKT